MSIFGFSFTEHSDLAEPYKTFVRQMSKWYNGGEMPELASQDLRFALELQRQKLQSLDLICNAISKIRDQLRAIFMVLLTATEYSQTAVSTEICA